MKADDLTLRDIRLFRLLGKVAEQPLDDHGRHRVAQLFADAGPEIGHKQAVFADLNEMQQRRWLLLPLEPHWDTAQVAKLMEDGRAALEEFGLLDRDRSQERTACRRRLATWLDAHPPTPGRSPFLDSPEGQWLRRPFDARTAAHAEKWLVDEGYARRDAVSRGFAGSAVLDLTSAGQAWLDGDRPDSGGSRYDVGPGGVITVVDRSPGAVVRQHGQPRNSGGDA